MTVVWTFPTRVLFGAGAIENLGAETLRTRARHWLIVTDRNVANSGVLDPIKRSLHASGHAYSLFDNVEPNPREAFVENAFDAFSGAHAEGIIAVGGGSVIDVAKLLRLRLAQGCKLSELDPDLLPPLTTTAAPLVAVPTTAGPGAEVTNAALVKLGEHENKTAFYASCLLPGLAILDPHLTSTLPPHITAATGFDALAHAVEAYCAKGDHPMADALALESIELVGAYLGRAVQHGDDLEARGSMQKAAMMAGVAAQKGLGAAHALAHPLGSENGVAHGVAHAICLPAVLDFNRSVATRKLAKIARILGVRGNDVESLAFECSGAISSLRRACHLPEQLRELGVDSDSLQHLATLAAEDPAHAPNPRPCTRDDMLTLYRACL